MLFSYPDISTSTSTVAAAFAILRLVTSYSRYRDLFAENAQVLRNRHRGGAQRLSMLLETAAFGEPAERVAAGTRPRASRSPAIAEELST